MTRGRLEKIAAAFKSDSDTIHSSFLEMLSDEACTECSTSRYGEAILAAWLQTSWSDFNRELVIGSAQGTRRTRGGSVRPVSGVRNRADADKVVKVASTCFFKSLGLGNPIWHAPWYVIGVGKRIGLQNLETLELALGPSTVPKQITDFRNYLVHPDEGTRSKYENLLVKLGLLDVEQVDLPRQKLQDNQPVFTWWVTELQKIAMASTR